MRCDQFNLQRRIKDLQAKVKNGQQVDEAKIQQLSQEIQTSLQKRQQRTALLPIPEFPEPLPICERREEIAELIQKHQVVILAGETGSGKTTQIPKICLAIGRGTSGFIGCTQPRRIAARTISQRVANELKTDLGQTVGYKIRFHDRLSESTYIKFMTDGILLAETQNDRFLDAYDTLIIDEAHERSLNIDFLLGYLKQLLPKRPDLKVIITSATIDTQRFSQHFDNAPILEVSGRTYPVEVRYRPLELDEEDNQDRAMQQAIISAVDEIHQADRNADILVFLPTERDIHETTENLHKHSLPHTEILPLYARLSASEQNQVFQPKDKRRIILTTNVAETSLTVPRIKAVIDTGLARISRYSVRGKVQRLPIEKISKSSADQRKGRCGRIAAGVCIRLYSADDYVNRLEFTEPEILRSSLASVILQMLALKLGDIEQFPFVEPPSSKMINDGFTLLAELGAVDSQRRLTEIGKQLAQLPIDPRLGRMILAAKEEQCLLEMLVITSALSIQDPRERPRDKQDLASFKQAIFNDENSDFLSFLKIWSFYQQQAQHLSNNKLRNLCHEYFLAYLRMKEWADIHHQLITLIKEIGWKVEEHSTLHLKLWENGEFNYPAIHRALLTGLLGNVATKNRLEGDKNKKEGNKTTEDFYLGTRNLKLYLFPGSGLYRKQPKWIMSAELVETTKLYARCAAKIEPEWIELIAGKLCQRHYFEPFWERKSATVGGYERVTLYGLTLIHKRKVNYGAICPEQARQLFIQHALVEGEYYNNAPFFQHNQTLLNAVQLMEHKARRSDIIVNPEEIFAFYHQKIPAHVHCGQSFEQWRKTAEKQNSHLLFLQKEDVILPSGEHVTDINFPNEIIVQGVKLPLRYHFEPAEEDDGVTVVIPTPLLNQISAKPFEWLVLGFLEEKVTALIRLLPKNLRKYFVPIPDTAKQAIAYLTASQALETLPFNPKSSLLNQLSIFLQNYAKLEETITLTEEGLLPYLRMNFLLVDIQGAALAMSRDFNDLQMRYGAAASQECRQQIAKACGIERTQVKGFDFEEIPEKVSLNLAGIEVQGFPTLIDKQTAVDLVVLDHPKQAKREYYQGFRRLVLLSLGVKNTLKQLPIDAALNLQYLKIGKSDDLYTDLLDALVDDLFMLAPLPRTKTAFEQRLQQGKAKFASVAKEYVQQLRKILEVYQQVLQELANPSPARKMALPEIKQHLTSLVYVGFIRQTPFEQLKHLPRYLKAIQIRLERLDSAPQKDEKRAKQMGRYWETYLKRVDLIKSLEADNLNVNLETLIQFRWTLEELRVSLFAQELKTAFPISIEKIDKMWTEIF